MADVQAIIDAGHPPVAAGVVLVDFDATLFPFGLLMDNSEPLSGAPEAMRLLKAAGCRVIIFTSRMSPTWWEAEGMHPVDAYREQTEYITRVCAKYDIPFDGITAEKIPAMAYFDDKAFRVTKSEPLLVKVKEFLGAA